LIRIYGGALAKVKDQKVQYKPFRASAEDTDVIVRTAVVGKGEPIQLDYRLEKGTNGWKVYDINILGAWLVESYRNQFNDQISKGGIEGLIKFLQDRNTALSTNK
jgi:phospholipid transport system substrate-binding protein